MNPFAGAVLVLICRPRLLPFDSDRSRFIWKTGEHRGEQGSDDQFKVQFEAVFRVASVAMVMVKNVLDSIILNDEARRWSSVS